LGSDAFGGTLSPMNRLLVVTAFAAAPALAEPPPTAIALQREARGLIDAAVAAHGGEQAIAAAGPMTVAFVGRRTMIGQSWSPTAPYGTEPWKTTTTFDPARRRIVMEQDNHFPGGYLIQYRTVVDGDTAYNLNLDKMFDGPFVDRSFDAAGTRAWLVRESPIALLQHARERAPSLRPAPGGATFAEADGSVVALRLDPATHRLVGFETISDHGFVGDNDVVVEWSGWKTDRGVTLPTAFRETRNGGPSREGTLTVTLAPPDESLFAIPPGFGDAPAEPPPVRMLADGVGLVHLPDETQVLYVDLGDALAVIEAPSSSGLNELAIQRIEAAAPGRPIKYVAFTHAHNDHAAGLRAYIARGVTIVTTEENRAYVEAVARAPHTLAPDRQSRDPRAPVLQIFRGETELGTGARRVRLYSIGKTSHVVDTVVAYLPAEQIIYQGDMLIRPRVGGGVAPGQELTRALARLVRDKKLAVKVVVGTHGPTGTMDTVRAAIGRD
jgi:glyoxylase-like metal-dependent hydrolase (beta-lactamase superfamily II)